ncbi:MAG: SPOR domain-containing protein [Novosphingobium sp.]|uniref:SPOR domain-containing protein n=1 Tax=Novosphingobium sp. TaxID=1874826 RepID=UPI0032BE6BE5
MTGINGDREGEGWHDEADEPLETERLALDDGEERLPWLESTDDEDYDEDEGSDMGHTLRLGLLALAALAAIVLGIYWVTHRNPDQALTADGSLVTADPQPYKEAPKDPGGKTFDGTGDTSFAVSEGQNKPAQMAGAAPAAAPAADAKPAAAGAAPAAATGGVGVQVGAFSSKEAAEAGWSKLVGAAGGALSGVSHRVISGSADNGTIFRLQAVAPDAGAAQSLCGKLKGAGISCQVK